MKAIRNVTLLSLALAATLAITPAAKADFINGSMDVSIGNDTWSATQLNFNALLTGYVLDSTGNLTVFPSTPPTSVAITGATLVFGSPTSTPDVFTFISGGNTGTFTFTDVNIITDNGSILSLTGDGWLTLTGKDQTYAVFTASGADSGGLYGVNSSGFDFNLQANPAPEPGTLTLFGTGLLGLAGMLRRKFMASR